jgi:hypothetical protein
MIDEVLGAGELPEVAISVSCDLRHFEREQGRCCEARGEPGSLAPDAGTIQYEHVVIRSEVPGDRTADRSCTDDDASFGACGHALYPSPIVINRSHIVLHMRRNAESRS